MRGGWERGGLMRASHRSETKPMNPGEKRCAEPVGPLGSSLSRREGAPRGLENRVGPEPQ